MLKPTILRKRYIPDEIVDISKDELIHLDEDLMVTKWNTIHPRSDIARGISFTFLKDGWKISKLFNSEGEFVYWYCDIIDTKYDESTNTYTLIDLLADVKIMPDGKVLILDLDELAEALEKGIITKEQACDALMKLSKLLDMINKGEFPPKQCTNIIHNA